jgi:uncharacterized membrane protein/transcriptional regulator with XRE-family HTH domain
MTPREKIFDWEPDDDAFAHAVAGARRNRELVSWLARWRSQRGLSQADVAKSMQTSQPAVTRLESQQHDPQLSTLVRYITALGLSLEFALIDNESGNRIWASEDGLSDLAEDGQHDESLSEDADEPSPRAEVDLPGLGAYSFEDAVAVASKDRPLAATSTTAPPSPAPRAVTETRSTLIAIGYPDETTAKAAAEEARRLARDLIIEPDAIAVVVRDHEGKYHVHTSHQPVGAGATWGTFWGLLFGLLFFVPVFGLSIGAGMSALMGKVTKSGIDREFQDQVRGLLQPGTSALFLMVEKVTPDKAVEAMSKYGGTVLKTSLSKQNAQDLQEALHGGSAAGA